MHIADKTIKNGDATPMIIIMPDAIPGSGVIGMTYQENGVMKIFSLRNLFRI